MTPQNDTAELLLQSMRSAVLNLRTWQSEIETVGIALRDGKISMDDACAWLDDLGLLHHLPEPERKVA